MVARFPSAIRRTFTVLQFARLADRVATLTGDDPVELGRTLVQESLLARSDVRPGRGSEEDIADPIGRASAVVRRRAADIDAIDASLSPLVVRSPSSRRYGLTLRQLWISPQRQLIEPVDAPRASASAELAFGCSVEP